jgi:nitrate/nitrite transport system ATP-binding protein
MAYLELRDVSKSHGCGEQRTPVLRHVGLSVAEGECVAIVGEPGSGKSTLLGLVAGLTMPDFGSITLAGRPIAGPGPDRLFLSHNCALLPWLTVMENLMTSVESVAATGSKEAARRQAEKLLDASGLTPFARKKPRDLTAGQRKRVALARTLAMNPDVLLLDDPFAGLDATTRAALQAETARMLAAERKTCLLATDDPTEALLLADRVFVLAANHSLGGEPLTVDLPRPRDRRSPAQQTRFNELRKTLSTRLRTSRIEPTPEATFAAEPTPVAAPHFERLSTVPA